MRTGSLRNKPRNKKVKVEGFQIAHSPFGFKGLVAEGLHDRFLWSGESPQLLVSVRKLLRVVA